MYCELHDIDDCCCEEILGGDPYLDSVGFEQDELPEWLLKENHKWSPETVELIARKLAEERRPVCDK